MSYSSIYGIKNDFTGEELIEFPNSWFFSPTVWEVLPNKYIPLEIETPYGFKDRIIGFNGNVVWEKTNIAINNCNDTPDRICWELTNQLVFFTKDKQCIAESIVKFAEQNKKYDEAALLEKEHIIKRFNFIADSILAIDETVYPYFVFKNTSVDDSVEYWFSDYDEDKDECIDKSLKDWDKFLTEFVVIKDGKITNFISNLEYDYESSEVTA